MFSFRRSLVALGLFAAVLNLACRSNPPEQPPPGEDEQQLMHLVQLYSQYQKKHGGKSPGTTDELKKWAKALPAAELTKLGITNVEEIFVSPRDNQPYQLARPANSAAAKMGGQAVIFYEKTGANGKRRVIGGMGTRPRDLTDEELKAQVPDFSG